MTLLVLNPVCRVLFDRYWAVAWTVIVVAIYVLSEILIDIRQRLYNRQQRKQAVSNDIPANRTRDDRPADRDSPHYRRDEEIFLLRRILSVLQRIAGDAEHLPRGLVIGQLDIFGGSVMAITGVPVGGQGTFGETPQPPGSAFPTGTTFTWTSSDTANTSLTPSTDGTKVAMGVAAGATVGSSTVLTCSAQMPAVGGTTPPPVTGSGTVPYMPAVVPTPTSMSIDQIS